VGLRRTVDLGSNNSGELSLAPANGINTSVRAPPVSWYKLDVPAHQEEELEGLATALQTPFLLWNDGSGGLRALLDPTTAERLKAYGCGVEPARRIRLTPGPPWGCRGRVPRNCARRGYISSWRGVG